MRFTFSDGVDQYAMTAGRGHWEESTVVTRKLKPKLVDLMSTPDAERNRIAASYCAEDGRLVFSVRCLNCPHKMEWTFALDGGAFTADLESWGKHDPGAGHLTGTAL